MDVNTILEELDVLFPKAHCELKHKNPYELAVAVVLSAQTTDIAVNNVTPNLFKKYPTPKKLANAKLEDIEKLIARLGLYHNKAKAIQGLAKTMVTNFHGEVPNTMEDLVSLPGVGRKCANVILSECYGIPALAVDTHVERVAKRLGFARKNDSVLTVEKKLKKKIPEERWIKTHHQFIFFGRYLCHARNPECFKCPFVDICKEKNKNLGE